MRIARDAGISLASVLYWNGIAGVEPEASSTLRYFFERSEVFVDVGENYGFYSVLAGLWSPSIRVVDFEPIPAIYEGLKKNIEANNLNPRVTCENMALSSHSGMTTLYLPSGEGKDLESSGTLASNSWRVRNKAETLRVQAIRFDEYEARRPMRVDRIKIDVEDFEADVLQGMSGILGVIGRSSCARSFPATGNIGTKTHVRSCNSWATRHIGSLRRAISGSHDSISNGQRQISCCPRLRFQGRGLGRSSSTLGVQAGTGARRGCLSLGPGGGNRPYR
jgi:FkbM family methyltransferase